MSKVNRASLQSLCYFKWPCVKVGLRVLLSLILTVWCQAGQSSEFSTETSAAAAAASSRLQSPASECLQEGQQIIFLFVTHISYSIQWTVHLVRIYWVNHLYTIKGKNSKPHPSVFNYTDVRLDWCSTRLVQRQTDLLKYQTDPVPVWEVQYQIGPVSVLMCDLSLCFYLEAAVLSGGEEQGDHVSAWENQRSWGEPASQWGWIEEEEELDIVV